MILLLIAVVLLCALICTILFLLTILIKLSYGKCKSSQHLVGKIAIVTGSNSGIGFETAKDFAERGARVILACRNEEKALKARDYIISATGNKDVHFYKLDLSSFKSIREFVENYKRNENRLDILVNNAGDLDLPITETEDGLLLGLQVNYFGPFLLTYLLLPVLKATTPSRIVNVSSRVYKIGSIDFENLNHGRDGPIGLFKVYGTAKLSVNLMTVELARRLEGTGVTCNALCPGLVASNIYSTIRCKLWRYLMETVAYLGGKDCLEGAQTQIYLSVASEVKDVSGCYFTECKQRKLVNGAGDSELAKKLWDYTENILKLNVAIGAETKVEISN